MDRGVAGMPEGEAERDEMKIQSRTVDCRPPSGLPFARVCAFRSREDAEFFAYQVGDACLFSGKAWQPPYVLMIDATTFEVCVQQTAAEYARAFTAGWLRNQAHQEIIPDLHRRN
jgi:hypothetical protein